MTQSAILWFATKDFVDSDDERQARINETIGGAALAGWLASELRSGGLSASEPWAEDHGWDFEVKHDSATYMIVCTIEDIIEDIELDGREACVQVHKKRSFFGRRAPFDREDPLVGRIAASIESRGAVLRYE